MNISRMTIMLTPLVLFMGCKHYRRDNVILVPNSYIGPIRIEFDIKDASALQIDGNRYMIKIPQNGILRTSTHHEEGWGVDIFYYYAGNKRWRLYDAVEPYPSNATPPRPMVWDGSVSVGSNKPLTLEYFIGSHQQWLTYEKKRGY